ncbi:AraC family transcriptional regulator [Flagellimonas flava]|uniref:AraC-type DNA-binding protein n=1 Tax=Flagellimonas flava TaxID=570519 RepID=A0A1M5JYN8_9FLAO|nr:AraC family transcriptional regulator [Allomuricauda flava]SHG45644.1 AraC-type DNA-binding protein [Allomuricauda flava]
MQRDIKVTHWKSDLWENLTFSTTEYKRFQFAKHFHDYYSLIHIMQGINNGFTQKSPYRIGPGTTLLINPGELHAGNSIHESKLRFVSILFYPDFLNKVAEVLHVNFRPSVTFVNKPLNSLKLNRTISNLIGLSKESQDMLAQECAVLQLFHLLLDGYTNCCPKIDRKPPRPYLGKAVEFIKENCNTNFSLDQLSQYSGISQYHLIREFKNTYQQTPYQFLRNIRIEKSKRLLIKKIPITQIAMELGFFDHSHFTKSFVRNEGILPSVYQNLSMR